MMKPIKETHPSLTFVVLTQKRAFPASPEDDTVDVAEIEISMLQEKTRDVQRIKEAIEKVVSHAFLQNSILLKEKLFKELELK